MIPPQSSSDYDYLRLHKSSIWLIYLGIVVVVAVVVPMAIVDPSHMATLGESFGIGLVGGMVLTGIAAAIYMTWKDHWKDTNPVRLDCALGLFVLVVLFLVSLGATGFGIYAVCVWQ